MHAAAAAAPVHCIFMAQEWDMFAHTNDLQGKSGGRIFREDFREVP